MSSRRIPFITTMHESSESDNDVEPKTRLFRKQKHKKDSIGGVSTSTGAAIPPAVSEVLNFVIELPDGPKLILQCMRLVFS